MTVYWAVLGGAMWRNCLINDHRHNGQVPVGHRNALVCKTSDLSTTPLRTGDGMCVSYIGKYLVAFNKSLDKNKV